MQDGLEALGQAFVVGGRRVATVDGGPGQTEEEIAADDQRQLDVPAWPLPSTSRPHHVGQHRRAHSEVDRPPTVRRQTTARGVARS
jgi:hypothetical protein